MKTLKVVVTICAVLLFASTALAQPDKITQQKLSEIESKVEDIKSYKVTMKMDMKMMGQSMLTEGKMAFKKPDKFYMKSETNMMGGATQEIFSSGDILWTYMPKMGMATKMDMKKLKAAGKDQAGMGGQGDLTNPFKGLSKDAIKYIETKETDEGKVYVFETKPDFGGQMPPGAANHQMLPSKIIISISTETGLPTKTIMIGKNGATMMEQTYSDFQINPNIEDSVFEFTPPTGVQVMDMTKGGMNMMQQMQGSQPK